MSNEPTAQEYFADVMTIAEEAIQAEHDGGDLYDVVHENVDSSQWVIYTYRAKKVLEFSSNDDAAFEEMGKEALDGCESFADVCVRLAYFAMCADVNDVIASDRDEIEERLGLNKEEDEEEEEEEESTEAAEPSE